MNSLSLLIYLADIVGGISTASVMLSLIGIFVSGACLLNLVFCSGSGYYRDENQAKISLKLLKVFASVTIFLLLVAVLTPSKEGIYLIAASEAGEEVVKSDLAKKSLQVIENYLDDVIADQMKGQIKDGTN